MFAPGDIISHGEMCAEENRMLQAGMHFRCGGNYSVLLMSTRENAPYEDDVLEEGKELIYEGHDWPKSKARPYPKQVDQPMNNLRGSLTQNGRFYRAAKRHNEDGAEADLVRVYEKLYRGIWVYNGLFRLVNSWLAVSNERKVFKFRLVLTEQEASSRETQNPKAELDHTRMIPTAVKREVFKRDDGKCRECGATDNLHFDHILPYAKGGTSLKAENIQLLCARHNLQKSDRIQ